MPTPISRNNPKIKQIRALRQRKVRQGVGLFVVEGIRHVGEALAAQVAQSTAAHISVEYICYSPDLLTSEFAIDLVREQTERGLPCLAVTREVFASLADKENPQGILAVVRPRPMKLSELGPDNFRWGVALVAPQDPGNIGTILRTIDGVGASGLLLLDDPQEGLSSADAYHPNAVRASMGTLFWYPVVISPFADFAGWARQNGYHVYGTSAHGSTDYREVESYPRPCILLMGSEREGLTPGQVALCQALIRMPMRGHATSLNLAVATGVMLYAMLEKPLENSS